MNAMTGNDKPEDPTPSGNAKQEPLLTDEQEAFLLPILMAAYSNVGSENEEGQIGGRVGCGVLILAIAAGFASAQLFSLDWPAAVAVGVAVAIAGFVTVCIVVRRRGNQRRKAALSHLSKLVDVPLDQLQKLYDMCIRLEWTVHTCHKSVLEIMKRQGSVPESALPTGGTKFGNPPEGLGARRGLFGLGHLIAELTKPRGLGEGLNTGRLKAAAESGQNLADEIARFVRGLQRWN